MDTASRFYTELVDKIGEVVGVADGEPYRNAYLGQWLLWVNFASAKLLTIYVVDEQGKKVKNSDIPITNDLEFRLKISEQKIILRKVWIKN
ncbi:hypothetical protein [Nostoc sphaeroides]|uniref:DNA primase (Plasmid) n=1 Tax=Nostoc sphaeroides CCNUC1 TaxID=2653204 RepID=A0A5P8WF24_9NOSO|nr:hypothetical protein [Nostoc sphaeroides]QFS51435.1 DNA primase [Nostoc sphaeroides CCNUC1]